MTELEYIAYFEKLARLNKRIGHSAEHTAFFCLGDNNFDELTQAVRDTLNLPALALDQYQDTLMTANDNYRREIKAGFTVLCKFESGDPVSERLARDLARSIAESVVRRVRLESLAITGDGDLARFRILPGMTFSGDPAPIIGGCATGWSYAFTWTMPTIMAIDLTDWTDKGDSSV